MSIALPPALKDTTAAEKLVYLTIREADGPIDQDAIRDETELAKRTIRTSIRTLVDRGVINESLVYSDARRRLYTTTEDTGG